MTRGQGCCMTNGWTRFGSSALFVTAVAKWRHRPCSGSVAVAQSRPTLRAHGRQPARLLRPRGFPRQEHCSGGHVLLQGELPAPGIKPASPAWQVASSPLSPRNSGGTCANPRNHPTHRGTPERPSATADRLQGAGPRELDGGAQGGKACPQLTCREPPHHEAKQLSARAEGPPTIGRHCPPWL